MGLLHLLLGLIELRKLFVDFIDINRIVVIALLMLLPVLVGFFVRLSSLRILVVKSTYFRVAASAFITLDPLEFVRMVESFNRGVSFVTFDTFWTLVPSISIYPKCSYPIPLISVSQSSGAYLKNSGGLLKSLV